MATGSGKTFTSIRFIYRLIKFGGARRVLFLVGRGNLARQTKKEFDAYASPYNAYKFGEAKTRGKCTELRVPAATNQALAALHVDATGRGYLRHVLELNDEEMRQVASGGVQPNLNLSLVRSVGVLLPRPQSKPESSPKSTATCPSSAKSKPRSRSIPASSAQALWLAALAIAFAVN